jgi:hypothetical protein
VIQIHCSTRSEIDAIWQLLSHVPDEAFTPAEIHFNGQLLYQVIRTDGEQTTAPSAGQPACNSPAS